MAATPRVGRCPICVYMQLPDAFLDRCRRHDRRAIEQLHRLTFSLVMGLCRRYRRSEDEVRAAHNGAFLKIVQNLDKYRPEVPFDAWAKRVTINYLIDEWRRRRDHFAELEAAEAATRSTHNDFLEAEEAERLEAALHQLPPMTRTVFNLYAIDGYDHAEIGRMLDMSPATSRWHLMEARKKLAALLGLKPGVKNRNHG